MSAAYTTREAIFDAPYVDDYDVRLAAAVDAGDASEAGRLLIEATAKAKAQKAENDTERAELDAEDALEHLFGRPLTQLSRVVVVPVVDKPPPSLDIHPIFRDAMRGFRCTFGDLAKQEAVDKLDWKS